MGKNDRIRQIQSRLVQIRTVLLTKYPFFGKLVMQMKLSVASCGTACTDMKRLIFDPDFVERLSDKELMFVFMHEVMHCALKHPKRGKGKIRFLYNVACDIVVNSNILEYMGIEENEFMIDGEYVIHLSPSEKEGREMTADEVYKEFFDVGQKIKVYKRKNKYARIKVKNLQTLDNQDIWESIDIEQAICDRWDDIIKDFVIKGCSDVKLPQTLRRMKDDAASKAKLKWKDVLSDYLSDYIYHTDTSFSPPDRRFSDSDFFMPNDNIYADAQTAQNIWFCIDTSGSILTDELTHMYGEVMHIVDEIEDCTGSVSFFNTSVTKPEPFKTKEDFEKIKPSGGGGTSLEPIFAYMKENMSENPPRALVILTDGYVSMVDEKDAMGVPVIWILVNNPKTMDWGKTVNYSTD